MKTLPLWRFQVAIDWSVMTLDYDPESDYNSLAETLKNLEDFWYLGMESEPEWIESVGNNVPALFTMVASDNDYSRVVGSDSEHRTGSVSSRSRRHGTSASTAVLSSASVVYRFESILIVTSSAIDKKLEIYKKSQN